LLVLQDLVPVQIITVSVKLADFSLHSLDLNYKMV
jgi:hypothetical protein